MKNEAVKEIVIAIDNSIQVFQKNDDGVRNNVVELKKSLFTHNEIESA